MGNPQQIYAGLALKRGFYGFLSADILGDEYNVIDSPVQPSDELMHAIANLPAIKRAKELWEINEITWARREWYQATRNLSPSALTAAAKTAESWGWYRKSIQAMIEAKHWDDLQLRFPLAYQDQVQQAAKTTAADPTLLFAIARQESAFAYDAKSSAGALGLMQLMPATAKQTAQRAGVKKFSTRDLIRPEINIRLGSRYLDQLLNQFDGNRIFATAAYNAGPYRVKQWLSRQEPGMPFDIWIETIPFKETRHYVQNVMVFSVIYSYRLGTQAPKILPRSL